jgi:hypothetical protein
MIRTRAQDAPGPRGATRPRGRPRGLGSLSSFAWGRETQRDGDLASLAVGAVVAVLADGWLVVRLGEMRYGLGAPRERPGPLVIPAERAGRKGGTR